MALSSFNIMDLVQIATYSVTFLIVLRRKEQMPLLERCIVGKVPQPWQDLMSRHQMSSRIYKKHIEGICNVIYLKKETTIGS